MSEKTLSPEELDRLEEFARAADAAEHSEGPVPKTELWVSTAWASLAQVECGPDAFFYDLPALILSLVSMARRAPRWTPVEEGLPEDAAHVLIFRHVMPGDADTEGIPPAGYHYVDAAYYSTRQGFIPDGEEDYGPAERVTHWAPLPEPPEVKP